MTIAELLAALTAAGATRVRIELDFAPPLPPAMLSSTLPPDQAPRVPEDANAQAESHVAQPESAEDEEQRARDLELAHLDH